MLILIHNTQLLASGLSSGRSVGMAGAYTAAARGAECVFWNPANLGFSDGSEKTLNLLSFGMNINNNSFNWGHYTQYNGKFLTAEDKQNILDLIPLEGFNLKLDADISALNFSWGNFALTLSGQGSSDLLLPKEPIEALLFGNELNDTLLIQNSDGEAYASFDIGLSYGRSILKGNGKELFCGGSIRYKRGLIYQKVKKTEGELVTLETGINGEGDFALNSAGGGKGYALDLGFAMKYRNDWTFGLSFLNLLNRIKWDKEIKERGYQFRIDSLLAENFDTDSLMAELSYTRDIDPFTTKTPTLMRLGVAHQSERLLWALDFEKGLGEGMGVSRKAKASLGAEFGISGWLDLLAGFSIGGGEGITFANGLGFNLGNYHLDIGMANHKGLWPTKSKGMRLAISTGFLW
ncbi:MAG: DUF5723 family protein [Candidatus Zixiibacteriota bacterium]